MFIYSPFVPLPALGSIHNTACSCPGTVPRKGKQATEAANAIAKERNFVQSQDIGKVNKAEIKEAMDGVLKKKMCIRDSGIPADKYKDKNGGTRTHGCLSDIVL